MKATIYDYESANLLDTYSRKSSWRWNTESLSVRKRVELFCRKPSRSLAWKLSCWNTGWKFWLKARRRSSAVAGPHASHAKMTCALCRVAAVADLLSNFALFDERQANGTMPGEKMPLKRIWWYVHFRHYINGSSDGWKL